MENNKKVTRIISGDENLTIRELDGKLTMSQATGVFKWISSSFQKLGLNKPGRSTEKTNVVVHEMTNDGTFLQIFTGINPNLEASVMSIGQISEFCKEYSFWLRQEWFGTFFLTKKRRDPLQWLLDFILRRKLRKYFVVFVDVSSDGLDVRVSRLEHDHVWYGEFRRRVVYPQPISSEA